MKCVSEKIKCQKIDRFYYKTPKGRIFKYSQFCRRTVKLNLLIILKTLNLSIALNTKKKIWLIQKENINYVKNVNHLIKQNVLQKNANIQFKNIKQLQNT